MKIHNIATQVYLDQIPGTSGLRKKTKIFLQENYLQNYIQGFFNAVDIQNKTIVLGGDGRYFSLPALQIIIRMAVANGVKKIYVAQYGYLSTPAASIFIRKYHIDYGIILSASHNPAGIAGDFGIKINESNGAPAHINTTNKIIACTQSIREYAIVDEIKLDVSKLNTLKVLNTEVEVVDGIKDYVAAMQEIFNFTAIDKLINQQGFQFCFNGLNGITGPYAVAIFQKCFKVPQENLLNICPQEDFGGLVADPNPTTAVDFMQLVRSKKQLAMGFACDADGDRNMIFSQKYTLEPSDSIALMLEYAHLVDYYKNIVGVARSKPTSPALDLVAKALNIPCYKVPTGWKFFSNLLDANKISLCGEESFGTGSNHSREKDGLWAILYWLHILATEKKSFEEILEEYWLKYGRVFFARYDVENMDLIVATEVLDNLEYNAVASLNKAGQNNYILQNCEQFNYIDPLTGETVMNQGLILTFNNGAEVFLRLSGTATGGSTMRCYFSQYCNKAEELQQDKFIYLEKLVSNVFSLMPQDIKYTFRV